MGSALRTMSATRWFLGGEIGPVQCAATSSGSASVPVTKYALGKTFRAAVLLSGGVKNAEAAMLDAIHRMDPEQLSDDAFFLASLRASIASGRQFRAMAEDAEDASSILAPELKRILLLAPRLRLGLVLRVLLGFSDEECARLDVRNASASACAAVRQLARIRKTEKNS